MAGVEQHLRAGRPITGPLGQPAAEFLGARHAGVQAQHVACDPGQPLVAVHYVSLCSLLVAYPMVIVHKLANGSFLELTVVHLGVLGALGTLYGWGAHIYPEAQRVHPLNLVPMIVVMPVTYILLTPLALFTLDSSSWETRKHQGSDEIEPASENLEAAA